MKFTKITSNNPSVISKIYSDGSANFAGILPREIVKISSANLLEGTYEVCTVDNLKEFYDFRKALKPSEAIITCGVPKDCLTKGRLTTTANKDDNPSTLARNKNDFTPCNETTILGMDFDEYDGEYLKPKDIMNILNEVLPEIVDVETLQTFSSSSYIYDTEKDEYYTELKGVRVYIPIIGADRLKDFKEHILHRSWELGYGYIQVSSAGSLLTKCFTDLAVFSHERIDFPLAVLEDGLEYRYKGQDYKWSDGGVLDLNKIAYNNTPEYIKSIQDKITHAKNEKLGLPEVIELQESVAKARSLKDIGLNASIEKKLEYESKILKMLKSGSIEYHLPLDYCVIVLENGLETEVTVSKILSDKVRFNGCVTLDPFEPDYQGRGQKGKIFLSAEKPMIYSLAHGGIKYFLGEEDNIHEKEPVILKQDDEIDVPFPFDAFPAEIRTYASTLSKGSGIDEKIFYSGVLSVISTMFCDKTDVEVRPSWHEKLPWNTCYVATTGSQKTLLLNSILRPVREDVKDGSEQYQREMTKWNVLKIAIEKEIKSKEKELSDLFESGEFNHIKEDEITTCIASLKQKIVTSMPKPLNYECTDITPETLSRKLKSFEKDGKSKVLIVTDEGETVFNQFTGHYKDGKTNNNIYLQGNQGGAVNVSRQGYEVFIPEVYISYIMTIQPEKVIEYLGSHGASLKGQGMLSRIEFVPYKQKIVPFNEIATDLDDRNRYCDYINSLKYKVSEESLQFSQSAIERFAKYHDIIRKSDGEDDIDEWMAKGTGKLARLCGLLCIIEGNCRTISVDNVDNAFKLLRWYKHQAISFSRIGQKLNDERFGKYVKFLSSKIKDGVCELKLRDFCRKFHIKTKESIEVITDLKDANIINYNEKTKIITINKKIGEM